MFIEYYHTGEKWTFAEWKFMDPANYEWCRNTYWMVPGFEEFHNH